MPKNKPEFFIRIKPELCKSCGLCVEFCGRDALKMYDDLKSGKRIPKVVPERCNACGLCEWYCPDFAIYVVKKVAAKAI
ncbi:MAG: ferredoxin family protein [Promethearchaeota archaeon]